jgi:hypothetical protein
MRMAAGENRDDTAGVMDIADVRDAIAWQAEHLERADAPNNARVIRALLAVLETDTTVARRMNNWHGLTLRDAMPLRIAAGLHYLVLSGEDTRLDQVYDGLITNQDEVDTIVAELVKTYDYSLMPWLDGPPQTNEAGRSASVMATLMWLSGKLGPKFELNEIGASAGINTMMGRYFYDLGGVKTGPSLSSMKIKPEWRGPPPPANPVEITAVRGCDIKTIDLTDPDQALKLKAYIWPDAKERMARMDTAIAMAERSPPELVRMDAGDFVEEMLAEEQEEGVTRVLFHTVMWQYLPDFTRERIEAAMEEAGAKATPERPLAWITVETNRETYQHETKARYWPGGEEWVQLAEAHPHGAWVEWQGS